MLIKSVRGQVIGILPEKYWIDPESISALMVKDGVVENIVDADLMHIMAEKIDSVSTCINEEFDSLMDIDMYGTDR